MGEAWAEGDKAYSNDEERHRASNSKQERRVQSPLNLNPLVEANLGWERGFNLKGPLSKLGQEMGGKKPIFLERLIMKRRLLQWERGTWSQRYLMFSQEASR